MSFYDWMHFVFQGNDLSTRQRYKKVLCKTRYYKKKISEPQKGSLIHITNTPKYNCGVQRFLKPPQPILYF